MKGKFAKCEPKGGASPIPNTGMEGKFLVIPCIGAPQQTEVVQNKHCWTTLLNFGATTMKMTCHE
jgi:hypothetical protein